MHIMLNVVQVLSGRKMYPSCVVKKLSNSSKFYFLNNAIYVQTVTQVLKATFILFWIIFVLTNERKYIPN